jgi:two-component system cell cycle sensor histidine kinase/response regulator CckA
MTSRQTLSAEARRLAAIVASSDDAIIGKDLNGIVSSWNPGAEGLFGYTAAEMIGQPITRLIPPEHRADEVRILDRIRRGERVGAYDTQRRTKDGRLIDVCVTVSPIKDPDGRIIGASKVARDISRRKRTDEALRYERDRAQQYLDTAGVILLALDMQGRITLANRYACNVLGWTAEELLGRDFIDVCVPAAIRSETRDKLREVHAGDDSVVENPIVTRGGDERLIEWRTAYLHDGAGRVTGTLSSGSDITDRKRAQAAVREERDRAQRYLDTAEVILLALDVDGRITLINRKGCDVLGRCEAELLGRKWVDTCIPPRHRPLLAERFENLIAGDVSLIENPILGKDGQERMVEWRNRLLRDDAGRVVGTLSSGGDITERHAAIEALRIAEERMRFALQHANVGIWDLDYATGVLRWSETLEGQYGLRPGTFRGTFDAFMELVHPDDRPALRETIEAAMKSGAEFYVRNRSLARDGKVRWLTGVGRVLLGDDGQPLRGVGISLDVTAHRTLEEQYYQAQKMEAVGRLAGGVAHDFNNLLTVILGYCDLLLDERGEDAPDRSEILEIQKAGTNAVSLVRQLLAFSRKQIIQPTLIDLNAVVENMRGMLGRLIGEDVRVVVTLSPDLSKVKADQGQLEQIVMNLAVNARDAMPRGGTLTIETAEVELDEDYAKAHLGAKPGSYVALTITDTGTGMTPEVQARLFEPFFTTKEVGKGTGLGLATVHGIVAAGGGTLGVYSELGKGTSFKVYLPAGAPGSVATAPSAPPKRTLAGSETVLVVDDAEGLRKLARRILEGLGYKVLTAANADEARRTFEQHNAIDVLLTDVVMPGKSGPDLRDELIERRPGLTVIYMSGYAQEAISQHGVLKPGIHFLPKPFSAETLGRKIRDALERIASP